MSNHVSAHLFGGAYEGKRVLVTGDTGFKGSWLSLWLQELGAEVFGYALSANELSHHHLLKPTYRRVDGDIRNAHLLESFVEDCSPEIVFHLAAQPLVRRSYRDPVTTFSTNIMGTINVYQSCRNIGSVTSLVSITTDKVYADQRWNWGYRETDPLGGHDPYSCSKACVEMITSCFRDSFWKDELLCATCRAGNVIGGGDWSEDRLIPDAMRAAIDDELLQIRSPSSVRPWQHVLDPLAGYLTVGQKLLQRDMSAAQPWNFGPRLSDSHTVRDTVDLLQQEWPRLRWCTTGDDETLHETHELRLDSASSEQQLGIKPVWNWRTATRKTAEWYRAYHESQELITNLQLGEFIEDARQQGAPWLTGTVTPRGTQQVS